MSGKRNAKNDGVRANADTKVGSKRVRLLPNSQEEEAAAFESPQATELLDPLELPDAMKNLGIGTKRVPEPDVDATMTFDPAELLRDDPLPPADHTLVANNHILTQSENTSKEAGFESPLDNDAAPPATDILQLDHTLESAGVSLEMSFSASPMTLPEEQPIDESLGSLPSLPPPKEPDKRPSWLGNAQPVDLGRPQSANSSPFEDEKRSLPTGAFGPIDPEAVAPPDAPPKSSGCSPIIVGLALVVVVSGSLGAAFALGAFDGMLDSDSTVATGEDTKKTDAPDIVDVAAVEAKDQPKADPTIGDATAPTAETTPPGKNEGTAEGTGTEPVVLAAVDASPTKVPPGDAVVPPTTPEGTAAPTASAAAGAPKMPIGFVRVLDNTGSKLPELAETLQQSVLRQLASSDEVDAKPGPVRIGLLVELRLQSLTIGEKAEGAATIKAESDCSLVVRPTPLDQDEAESRNAHAGIDTALPVSTRLERGAVAATAIASCGEALAADLIAFASETKIDWVKAEKIATLNDKRAEKVASAKQKKRRKSRRSKRKRRRRAKR